MVDPDSATVSISAAEDPMPSTSSTQPPLRTKISLSSLASAEPADKDTPDQAPPSKTPPIILLPAVEIPDAKESTPDDANKENMPPLPATKKPLAKTSTSASSASSLRTKPTPTAKSLPKTTPSKTSSLTRTPLSSTTKPRPAIPSTLRPSTSSTSTTTSARSLAPPTSTTIRKSPSTPSLSTSTTAARQAAAAARRAASSSGGEPISTSSSPSSTPGVSRSASRASLTSSTRSPSRTSVASSGTSPTATRRLPSSSSTAPVPARSTIAPRATSTTTTTSTARRTPVSSTNPSPNSTLRTSATSTLRPGTAPTPVRKTLAASSTTASRPGVTRPATTTLSTRPVTDATKVKMLSSQLSGLQEKHDQTLKLLQEQEERLKKELEEMSTAPEHDRKPIPSDTQDVLQEMEELRTQFKNAGTQHQKDLEDLAAEKAKEISLLEALLKTLTEEKDAASAALTTLQASTDLSGTEKTNEIKALQDQLETSLLKHTELVAQHTIALEALRSEVNSAWSLRLETQIQELTREHEQALVALREGVESSVVSKDSEIQELKESFTEQTQALQDESAALLAEREKEHNDEIQQLKDKLSSQIESHDEILLTLRKEHGNVLSTLRNEHEKVLSALRQEQSDALGLAQTELAESRVTNDGLQEKLDATSSDLERTRQQKEEVEAELDQARRSARDEIDLIRQELNQIQLLLSLKEEETAELEKRVDGLMDELENASFGSMLKNTKRYKVKKVEIYGSSVSGNLQIKRSQQSISDILEQHEIESEFVDISTSEEGKLYMKRKNHGETHLPQIFSGGEYCGTFEDFEYALETHQLAQFLKFDRQRGYMPRHTIEYEQGHEMNEGTTSGAQAGEDAEQGAGWPEVVVNGLGNKLSMNKSSSSSSNNNLQPQANNNKNGTSMYLLSPASNRFQSNQSLASSTSTGSIYKKKPGFVQAASQVWDGALKEGDHQRRDLGFQDVMADDDELEELFEQGAVTEAELEAMLASS